MAAKTQSNSVVFGFHFTVDPRPRSVALGARARSSRRKTNFPKAIKEMGSLDKHTKEYIERKRKKPSCLLWRHGHANLISLPPRDAKHKNPFKCKDDDEKGENKRKERKKRESKRKDFHKGSKLADVVIMLLFFVFILGILFLLMPEDPHDGGKRKREETTFIMPLCMP